MSGWAGNAGGNKCSCGETGSCDGGPDVACNCDMDDGVLRQDHGIHIDKHHLPVSEVCFGYSKSPVPRYVKIIMGELVCMPRQMGECVSVAHPSLPLSTCQCVVMLSMSFIIIFIF